jgi:hypothetical protein
VTYRQVLDWIIGFIGTFYIQLRATGNTVLPLFPHTLQFTVTHYGSQSSLAVSLQRIYNSLTVTSNHTWHSLLCWEGLFTAPLTRNGSYPIVACVFVAAGMCLPTRCLAIKSDFTIPAFGRHVALYFIARALIKLYGRQIALLITLSIVLHMISRFCALIF